MQAMSDKQLLMLGLGVGLIFVFLPKVARNAAQQVATAALDVPAGLVEGIGTSVGIPKTEMSKCQQDLMAGRTWDASFSCPAADWIAYMFRNTIPK